MRASSRGTGHAWRAARCEMMRESRASLDDEDVRYE
jgi:hypothetical protein